MCCCQVLPLTFIEFFAGAAQATRMMRLGNHAAAKLDLKYHIPADGKMNYMDLNTPAGFAHLARITYTWMHYSI